MLPTLCTRARSHPQYLAMMHFQLVGKSKEPKPRKVITQYEQDCVETFEYPMFNVFATACGWLTLAGFMSFPNTFTSFTESQKVSESKGGKIVQDTVRNVPLLIIASVISGLGVVGNCGLWIYWRLRRQNSLYVNTYIFWLVRNFSIIAFMLTCM